VTKSVVIPYLLENNILIEEAMKKTYLFIITLLLYLVAVLSFASDRTAIRPNRSERFESKPNTSIRTPLRVGIDSQGNTSILIPNHSKGYIGVDSQGKALIATEVRGVMSFNLMRLY
jgi:hypothetical protein